MFDKMIEPLKKLPDQFETLREEVDSTLRHTAHVVRGESQQRLWVLETKALDWMDAVLEGAETLPEVFGKVTGPVEDFVQQRLDALVACPVENYETLNARNAARAVRDLGWLDLLRVRRIEESTKARKTVLDAVETALERLHSKPLAFAAA
jgi:hypothetical protein